MSYAKWLAILALASATLGCRHPCKVLASDAIALDDYCAYVSKTQKDGRLAAACGTGYTLMREALTTGTCSCEVGKEEGDGYH